MKINKIYFSFMAMLAMMLTACSSDDDYSGPGAWDAAEGYADVEFVKTSYSLEVDPTDPTTMQVELKRRNTSGSVTVPFTVVSNDDEVFTAGNATFADGEETATADIDFSKAEIGTTYSLVISIDDKAATSQYTEKSVCKITITRVKWNDVGYYVDGETGEKVEGYAMYREDYLTTFFGVENIEFPTRIQEREDKPGYFRLINTYGAGFPYNEPGDYDADNDYYIFIDATDPDKVFIPSACPVGMDWGYGMFYMHSFAGYYRAKNDPKADDYYGTYANGVISFPKGALMIAMADYNDGGLYASNNNGLFRIVLDPSKLKYEASLEEDFTWEEVFDGEFNSESLGTTGKAKLLKGTCVTTTDNCDKVFAEEYGTAYKVVAPYTDGYDLIFCVKEDGSITIPEDYSIQATGLKAMSTMIYAKINAAVSSFGENEIQLNISFQDEKGTLDFGTTTETLANITYTPVGTGTYTYTCLFENPISVPGYVLSKRDDKDNVYMISEWGDEEVNFIFTWDKATNNCAVAEQYYCTDAQYGAISVADIPTWQGDPAMYEDFPSYYDEATSTFHFNVSYFVSGGYFGYGEETFQVTFNSNAPAKAKAARTIPSVNFGKKSFKSGHKRPARFTARKTNIKAIKNNATPFAAF